MMTKNILSRIGKTHLKEMRWFFIAIMLLEMTTSSLYNRSENLSRTKSFKLSITLFGCWDWIELVTEILPWTSGPAWINHFHLFLTERSSNTELIMLELESYEVINFRAGLIWTYNTIIIMLNSSYRHRSRYSCVKHDKIDIYVTI